MLFLCIATVLSGVPNKAEAASDPLGVQAEAAILLDASTGKILYEKNVDTVLGVASMSKMMTEYIVLDSIKNNKISWDQKVNISEYVHKMSDESTGLSNVGLTQGEEYTVEELYQAMAIHSGNGATVALAELISGTEKNFVTLMNKKAGELGLKDYKFVNSSGLNNRDLLGNYPAGSATDENLMSARATAKLAFHLINDFPEVLETSKIPNLKFRDKKLPYKNFNWMLPSLVHGYEGVDGLKTGHTDLAGYCFTATAERNGQRFISVVMKAKTQDSRFTETRKILDYAFNNFTNEEIVKEHYQAKGVKSLPVIKGKEDKVKIYSKDAINMVIKSGEKENYEPVLVLDKKKLNENGELTAPIKKGEKIGYLTIKPKKGSNVEFLTNDGKNQITVDVVAAESVEKANWFVLMMRGIGGFFGDLFGGISSTVKGWF
ncbi:D-alanyl-D-alanine carboxypeptidase family protein [Bacillus massilinigeriensis]|uniref:D-alanyl-D-alanine carboxypeptidase family protein n=1 Tax=Bacillus massilionigeriensis TaxID=1805475 RepID=UPI00096AE9FF|nr:serine hydrolase [Bacillus massilionigeriensis]